MSDAGEYTPVTVLGPGAAAAFGWLRRTQAWDRRLTELRDEREPSTERALKPVA